jgi:hypothetical protein
MHHNAVHIHNVDTTQIHNARLALLAQEPEASAYDADVEAVTTNQLTFGQDSELIISILLTIKLHSSDKRFKIRLSTCPPVEWSKVLVCCSNRTGVECVPIVRKVHRNSNKLNQDAMEWHGATSHSLPQPSDA